MLRLLAEGHTASQAAAAIGCSRQCIYGWRADEAFRAAWDDAVDQATEVIESVLYNKARDGDLLACVFWLKSHKPGTYNRKQVIAVGGDPNAPPIGIEHNDELVRFYIPHNRRDEAEPSEENEEDARVTIEAEAEAGDVDARSDDEAAA